MSYIDIALPLPLSHLFTYRVPAALQNSLQVGSRVLVELGRRRVIGVAMGYCEAPQSVGFTVKDVLEVIDQEPVVPPELLRFLREMASYYFAPLGEVMRLALPALERTSAKKLGQNGEVDFSRTHLVGGRTIQYISSTDAIEVAGTLRGNANALLKFVRAQGPTPLTHLQERWSNARAIVKKLTEAGLVAIEQRELARDPFFHEPAPRDTAPTPTAAQTEAIRALEQAITQPEPHCFLLHGVTGSGKTEVYLQAIATAKARGAGALVLVPEIALTPQLVNRYRARFGDSLAVLHSGLNERDRHRMWQSLRGGEVDVAIGARSALLAPVPKLGVIIVDEEHDSSFKQEEGVRYHARDMAMLRAHRAGAVCVLGSATPSLETEYLARSGKVTRLNLPERAHPSSALPKVVMINLRRTDPGPSGDRRLSLPLHRKLEETLGRGEQAILFLNRRGFAPSVVCEACGTIATCPMCSVALTFHRRAGGLLRCHYCDFHSRFEDRCPTCQSPHVTLEGAGTERLEDTVTAAFPGARIARLDRDTSTGSQAEQVLTKFRDREIDILIGTQMVAKGHDVPNVTLVGVINADAALSMPDFRAAERSFQLLVQVAGRAGRGESQGTVLLQTRDPSHPALILAMTHDVHAFAEQELQLRAELGYPPFSRLALIRVDAVEEQLAREVATALAQLASRVPAAERKQVEVLGPAPAPIARLRARYRFRVLLKARERPPLRAVLSVITKALPSLDRKARVVLDVDPVSML